MGTRTRATAPVALGSAVGAAATAPASTASALPASGTVAGATNVMTASGAVATQPAVPGSFPHLSGDLDGNPELLAKLEALAARRGEEFKVTSGHRSYEDQTRLWNNRHNNPYPVARPGSSRHESGRAADVTIGGRAIQDVISASELRAAGLAPLAGDAVHVELP